MARNENAPDGPSVSRPAPRLMLTVTMTVLCGACAGDTTAPAVDEPEPGALSPASQAALESIRAATATYQSEAAALNAGFAVATPCVSAGPLGGMGYHYLNPDRLGDGVIDPSRPELLLYEPRANGSVEFIGVEFMVDADVWDATHSAAPVMMDRSFDEHRGSERHGLDFDHYELHVWSVRDNPFGLTAPFNPRVTCNAG